MNQPNRRKVLRDLASLATFSGFASVGCVPTGQGPLPDLVWGRRGMSEGRFLKPRAITIDDEDRLYIVDTTGRIQVFDTDGNFIRVWRTPETSNGRPTGLAIQASRNDALESGAELDETTVSLDDRRLLVADTHYYRMLSYSLDGTLHPEEQIGGNAGHGPGDFAFVTDAVCDENGCFYVGEYNASDRIQKFDPEGNFLTQWGGNGTEPGKFVRPQSLVVRGNVLWVADSCNHRIQRFDLTPEKPELIDVWGQPGDQAGQFFYPYDLTFASDGSLLVIEYKNDRVQRFDTNGKWIASWGGSGLEPGQLNQPWGVVVDSQDRVHILDSSNHRIQRIGLPV